ncbi:MAG: ATP-dependent helicase HrpB [Spirochaetaceae bacterium]|nr:ATP-dependent helicase HrpB [Spirochaetaceae bacterium]
MPDNVGSLPITPYLPKIVEALKSAESKFLVLTAETAAGKSTAVPPALLDAFAGNILMLEPRRLAAVAVASRVAELLGEKCGETAGYRLHLDSCVSAKTRFEVMTEAILVRMMQEDASLDGVSVVILDEFHERSIWTDLSLAFLKDAVQLRDDLFVLIMSATIDTERLTSFLGCEHIHVPGRQYPVEISYRQPENRDICEDVADVVRSIPKNENVLVFLPGLRELRRTEELLAPFAEKTGSELFVLHSSIPVQEQRKVLSPAQDGTRRIILSSAVAETSVTVPGITYVVDSGLSRINRLNTATGMNHLVTELESVFSAEQRAGRAGRTAKGNCIRLWSESDIRVRNAPVQIMCTELVQLVLECALWGVHSPEGLSWLDPPPVSAWNAAADFLRLTGCIESSAKSGLITVKGKLVLKMGVHPRIACIALESLSGNSEAVKYAAKYGVSASKGAPDAVLTKERARLESELSRRLRGCTGARESALPGVLCLLAGFPDRAAYSLGDGRYMLPSGRQASLLDEDKKRLSPNFPQWIIAVDADAGEREGRIYSFESVPSSLEAAFDSWLAERTETRVSVAFADKQHSKLKKTETVFFGKIPLKTRVLPASAEDATAAWCTLAEEEGIRALPWDDACSRFIARADFYTRHSTQETPQNLEETLALSAAEWLAPFIQNGTKLSSETVLSALRWKLDGDAVDKNVPERLTLPNGKKCKIVYETTDSRKGASPVIEIIIQQMFGCFTTPKIMGEPVLLKLLSPARRPLQVTSDLENFWQNTWPEICKEMKGRYPKHNWDYTKPDD